MTTSADIFTNGAAPNRLRSLSGLIDFDCAARWGSFTLAAQELHKTPAAVSLQVKQLEELVGFTLFIRHPRHITLTDKGQELACTVARILRELGTKVGTLRGSNQEHVLRITTTPSLAQKWLVPRLGNFTRAHPEFDIQLDSSERVVDVEHEDVDIAIRGASTADHPGALFRERMVVVYSPALLAPGQEVLSMADLERHPLLYDDSTESWAHLLRVYGVVEGSFDFAQGFTSMAVTTQAAVAGHGIALVAYTIAYDDVQKGLLKVMKGVSIPYPRCYYLVVAGRKAQAAKVTLFTAWVKEEMAAMEEDIRGHIPGV